ncbi:hypothetical protein MTR_1g049200 [Medicago truncatula]|uniref:Uncharacterized protein n=1 Tax=Medicago truncatula TaxID=3880 RepID=A0A072VIY3_MEDTR|nr:hypothetical protein MTR_1g049200 [Medicago truncatula]
MEVEEFDTEKKNLTWKMTADKGLQDNDKISRKRKLTLISMKTNNRGKAKNRGKEKNRGKTNNHGKAKMKESCAKKMDDRNVHHAFMPEPFVHMIKIRFHHKRTFTFVRTHQRQMQGVPSNQKGGKL